MIRKEWVREFKHIVSKFLSQHNNFKLNGCNGLCETLKDYDSGAYMSYQIMREWICDRNIYMAGISTPNVLSEARLFNIIWFNTLSVNDLTDILNS